MTSPGKAGFWTTKQISSVAVTNYADFLVLCNDEKTINVNNAISCYVDYISKNYDYKTIKKCMSDFNCNNDINSKKTECLSKYNCIES